MNNAEDHIWVVNAFKEQEEMRGEHEMEWRGATISQMSKKTLSNNMRTFVRSVSELLNEAETTIKGFSLDEVEVAATVTASGKIALVMLAEAGGTAEAGIKFIFKRSPVMDENTRPSSLAGETQTEPV